MSTASMFEFSRNLGASTAHITEQDNTLLEHAGAAIPAWVVYSLEYGFLVYVPEDEAEASSRAKAALEQGYSQVLIDLVSLARKEGCRYLLLDRDGPVYEGLPQFEW